MSINIAIDGPAGAGKSTIAKALSKELGFIYVDTGAMYRAMGLYLKANGASMDDEDTISALAENCSIDIKYENGQQRVIEGGNDVTDNLRSEDAGKWASATSRFGAVRSKLTQLQKDLAARENVVMDGRDIGSAVLPGAQLKIYLTASEQARGKRRYDELIAKGEEADLDQIVADIAARDHADMTREISPLVQAEDAILVDTSEMSIDQVVSCCLGFCKEKGIA